MRIFDVWISVLGRSFRAYVEMSEDEAQEFRHRLVQAEINGFIRKDHWFINEPVVPFENGKNHLKLFIDSLGID